MPLPRIAIVGRPNVGKSSLMNMLAKSKVSIVDPTPGVTRDRVSTVITLESPDNRGEPRRVELTDTGGYGIYVAEGRQFNEIGVDLSVLSKDVEFQIAQAVASADLILFVTDAQAGITPLDEEIARLLRERALGRRQTARGGKGGKKDAAEGGGKPIPVVMVANKVDGPRWESHAVDAAALGFGEAIPVSAKNNYMRRDFVDRVYELIGELDIPQDEGDERANAEVDMKLAIVGKRNAGKSTLVNTLAGEQRVIVSEIAGTTRDAVDVRFEMDGRSFLAIDTAGVRKKKSFADRIEWFAYDRAVTAVERADVVLLMIDATEPISQVDESLSTLIHKSFKPCVIVVNKWDLVDGQRDVHGKTITTETYEKYLRGELKGLSYAPLAFISAQNALNIRGTIDLAFELMGQSRERVTTGKLNRLVRGILDTRGPASKLGTFAKMYYVAQIGVAPPTIGMVVNKPELFDPGYERFLINRFREELPFAEVPIRLVIKGRRRDGQEHFADVREADERAEAAAAAGGGEGEGGEAGAPEHRWTEEEAAAFFEDDLDVESLSEAMEDEDDDRA